MANVCYFLGQFIILEKGYIGLIQVKIMPRLGKCDGQCFDQCTPGLTRYSKISECNNDCTLIPCLNCPIDCPEYIIEYFNGLCPECDTMRGIHILRGDPLKEKIYRECTPYKVSFGKHKGKILSNVPLDHISYMAMTNVDLIEDSNDSVKLEDIIESRIYLRLNGLTVIYEVW